MSNIDGLPTVEELETQLLACHTALVSYRNAPAYDPGARSLALRSVRHTAQNLQKAATSPAEQLSPLQNGGSRAGVLRLAIAIDLFTHISATEPQTITQLAQKINSTPEFVHRIARALAALDVLVENHSQPHLETNPKPPLYDTLTYTPTPLGHHIATSPTAQAGLTYIYDVHVPALCSMGDYISTFGRQSPADPLNCPVVFSQGAKDIDYFAQMQKRPDRVERFESVMRAMNEASFAQMAGCYDFGGLQPPADGGGVVLVDVGGGDGRMLRRLREKIPSLRRGRCVLQDLPEVLEQGTMVGDSEGVEVVPYDFFAGEQPVKGAAAYFHQHILHDWPTNSCRTILRNLRPAMTPTSRLLLSEMIISNHNPSAERCIADMTIMVVGGMERNKSQWTELLASEGFRVVGFHGEENEVNGVIEAVRDEGWRPEGSMGR